VSGLYWVHVISGVAALVFGVMALTRPKTKTAHRCLGRLYMLSCFITCTASLYFAIFKYASVFFTVTSLMGLTFVLLAWGFVVKKPTRRWWVWHAIFMVSSYTTLICGVLTQFHFRIPIWSELPILASTVIPTLLCVWFLHVQIHTREKKWVEGEEFLY
jgi:uncharacterized membrane protein